MTKRALVTFHTAPPLENYYAYQKPPYRDVIGFSSNGSNLWTPRADDGYVSEDYTVDGAFAETLEAFFGHRFSNPDQELNCHMAAAGMRGLVKWDHEPTARGYAQDLLRENLRTPHGPNPLGIGEQGVYAQDSQWLDHSVVGLRLDEHIQLNGTCERYISILPAQYNHDYSFATPGVNFYVPKQG